MLKQEETKQIEEAIRAAEAKTGSEIVISIRQSSGEDRGIAALAGVLALALVGGLGEALWPEISTYLLLAGALAAGIGVFLLADWLDLGLKLLPARLLTQAAWRAARVAFLDHGLDATPQRNAVLLFVSRAERYVEILPDRGLAAAVPPQRWSNIVSAFGEIARRRGMVEAVIETIGRIGAVCAGPFPADAGNPDLIPNKPVTE